MNERVVETRASVLWSQQACYKDGVNPTVKTSQVVEERVRLWVWDQPHALAWFLYDAADLHVF